jgi:hypothetical protein
VPRRALHVDLRLVRALALAAAAALAVSALVELPRAWDDAEGRIESTAGLAPRDRDFLAARSADVATELFVAALETVPADARYLFLMGPAANPSSDLVLLKARAYAASYLLPRRLVEDPALADWVVSYGGDLSSTGLGYARIVDVVPGFQLAEVAR